MQGRGACAAYLAQARQLPGSRGCALRHWRGAIPLLIVIACGQPACHLVGAAISSGGQRTLRPAPSALPGGPYVILFALDGAGYGQFMDAIRSGRATHIGSLLGRRTGPDLFEHAYSVPNAITIMPSCSTAAWSSIMTGRPPAETGVAGDEFFVRSENRFYAPIPLSSRDSGDFVATIDDDLLGKILHAPTVYQQIKGASDVSLLYVYHGATGYSTLDGQALLHLVGGVIAGKLEGGTPRQSIAPVIDDGSIPEVTKTIRQYGIPKLMVVYFPGVDIYAHGSPNPLPSQTEYLESDIDPDVGKVLDEYSKRGVLSDTYVIFTADHGHTPVLNDREHDLGFRDGNRLFELLEKIGLRVREPGLELPADKQDYQAVIADEGFAAYLYLADRSTCPKKGEPCDWRKLPRFRHDTLPVLRALFRANRRGRLIPGFQGTLDLIFSRDYGSKTAERLPPFEVFDGRRLVPIRDYLAEHPRPDLVEVNRRMNWLGQGPYGDRAGDIVLIAKASMALPIQERYYFSYVSYFAWHGSLTLQDGHIPLVVAKSDASGQQLKRIVEKVVDDPPSALDVTPLIESVLAH
jgi:hypothetical protein